MKKVTLFAAMAALVFVSCNKEENLQLEMSNHTITASMETDSPETRTAFDRESGALYWIKGDDIAVLNTGGSFTEYTLTNGAGTANATFTAKAKIGENTTYALHPYSEHKYANSELTFNLPTSYTYDETEKGNEYGTAPMIAQTDEVDASNFYFEHLGGAFCFTIKNIPANTTYFKFVADEQITGDFPVVTNEDTDKFEISLPETQGASESTYAVTINFPVEDSATEKKFFIPLPVGTIDGFTISLGTTDGETWSYTSTKPNTITRKKLLAMPVVTLNASVDGTVATEISTPAQLVAAFANGGSYRLTSDITLTEALTAASPISLDLNSKTLNITGQEIGNGLINNSNLSIKNGSIYFDGNPGYGAAIRNQAQIQLDNVNVTSKTSAAFRNWGDDSVNGVTGKSVADAVVTAVINGGEFISEYNEGTSHSTHRYAVHGYKLSNLTMTGSTVKGSGGVNVDESFATLTNVSATHTCTYGAHDLYVSAGNATVVSCTFENAAAYSDETYGNAVVNGTTYGNGTTAIDLD